MKIGKKQSFRILIILITLLAVASPYAFGWHIEITMEFKPGSYLTNGLFNADPVKVYHYWLWINVGTSLFLSVMILLNLDKILEVVE